MTITMGVARDEIMEGVECVLELALIDAYPQITPDRVFWIDQAPDNPVPPRPFISCNLGPPSAPRAAGDRRLFPAQETWRFTFTSAVADTYTITLLGTDYTVVWAGGTIADLRTAMLVELVADTDSTSAADGTSAILTTANLEGKRLLPLSVPASITRRKIRADFFSRSFQIVELPLQIMCWGYMDRESPDPRQAGSAIAAFVGTAFMHAELTIPLRERGHVPMRYNTITDGTFVENQQAQTEGGVMIALATNARLDVQVGSTTQTPWSNASPQIQP